MTEACVVRRFAVPPVRWLVGIALCSMLAGCGGESVAPPGSVIPTPDDLLDAPSQLTLGLHTYEIRSYPWRNFQPSGPPDGNRLAVVVHLVEVDSLAVPAAVTMDYLWVVNGPETWATEFTDEERPPQPPYMIERVARDGPEWAPGLAVDVVARVRVTGVGEYRILRGNQVIEGVD
jgi:hypothetical protein